MSFIEDLVRKTPAEGWPEGLIIMDADDASRLLGVQPATLRQWIRRGKIRRIGRDEYDMASLLNIMVEQYKIGVAS